MTGSWGQAEAFGQDEDFVSKAPVRPRPTPLFSFAVVFWLASALCVMAAPAFPARALCAAVALAALGCLAAATVVFRRGGLFALAVLAVLSGVFVAGSWELSMRADVRALSAVGSGRAEFRAVADGQLSDFGGNVLADLVLPDGGTVRVRALFSDESRPLCGERFHADFTVGEPGPDEGCRLWSQGVVASVSAKDVAPAPVGGLHGSLLDLRREACALFEGREGAGAALLKAILVSDRADFEEAVVRFADGDEAGAYDAVKVLGLAHLVAVSGSHLVLVVGMVERLLSATPLSKKARALASAAFVLAYLVLAGMPVSAVRAAVMSLVTISSALFERRSSSLSSLGACVVAMVAFDPSVSVSLSFQLSALATLGIVVFSGLAQAWALSLAPGLPGAVRESVGLTASSSILAQPLSSAVFGQVPLCSPISNIVAGPWFALLCGGGLAALCIALAAAPLCFLLDPFVWAAQAFCELCALLSGLPGIAVPFSGSEGACLFASAVLCAVLWAWWPIPDRPRRRAVRALAALLAAFLVLVGILGPRLAPDRLVCLDVGQGDAILLQSQGASVLVDTGRSDALLLGGLAECGVASLDAVVVTHSDDDHCGSLEALRGVVPTERVVLAEDALSCGCDNCAQLVSDARALCGEDVVGVGKGSVLEFGAFTAQVVHPASYEDEGGNADSLVLKVVHEGRAGETTALLCGDAESAQLATLLEEGLVGRVDVLKVGHHGSKAAIEEDQALALDPSIALLSVGAGNSYGHPSEEALEALESAGSEVFRTDEDGAVVCEFSDSGMSVRSGTP